MAENPKKESQFVNILSKLTPLIIGIFISGVATYSSMWFEVQKAQITKLEILNDYRDLLNSDNEADRLFAYQIFIALDYKDLAVNLIEARRDKIAKPILQRLSLEGSSISKKAENALKTFPDSKVIDDNSSRERLKDNNRAIRTIITSSQKDDEIRDNKNSSRESVRNQDEEEDDSSASSRRITNSRSLRSRR